MSGPQLEPSATIGWIALVLILALVILAIYTWGFKNGQTDGWKQAQKKLEQAKP